MESYPVIDWLIETGVSFYSERSSTLCHCQQYWEQSLIVYGSQAQAAKSRYGLTIGQYSNVCVCVCVCVSRKSARRILAAPFISHSFRSWLIWKSSTSSFIGCKQFWDAMWSWPIYFVPKWPLPIKVAFFRYIWSMCEKTARDIEITSIDGIRKSSMGFQRHQNEPLNFTTSPLFGVLKTW